MTKCNLYLSWRKTFPKETVDGLLTMICICFFKMPYLTFVRWWVVNFKITFNKYYLIIANENKYFLFTRFFGVSYFEVVGLFGSLELLFMFLNVLINQSYNKQVIILITFDHFWNYHPYFWFMTLYDCLEKCMSSTLQAENLAVRKCQRCVWNKQKGTNWRQRKLILRA